jgi:hypothetical protein
LFPEVSKQSPGLLPKLITKAAKSHLLFQQINEVRYRIKPELFSDAILVDYFTEARYSITSFFLGLLGRDDNKKRLKLFFDRLLKLKGEKLDFHKIDENTLSEIINKLKDEVFFKKKLAVQRNYIPLNQN